MSTENTGVPSGGSLSTNEALLRQYYAAARAERRAEKPKPDGYADLGVTATVRLWAGYAMENRDVVLLQGPPACGKTYALERFCDEHERAWRVEMSPAICTPAAVLSSVADALELGDVSGGPARVGKAVARRFEGGNALLVIDEAHHLSELLLDEVRCIRGEASCGLVLAGNPPLWTRVSSGERSALYSRIGHMESLKRASESDVITLAEALARRELGAKGRDAAVAVSRGTAGFRAVVKMMGLAAIFARGDGRGEANDDDLAKAAARMKRGPLCDG